MFKRRIKTKTRSMLGLTWYFRQSIPALSQIASSFCQFLKKHYSAQKQSREICLGKTLNRTSIHGKLLQVFQLKVSSQTPLLALPFVIWLLAIPWFVTHSSLQSLWNSFISNFRDHSSYCFPLATTFCYKIKMVASISCTHVDHEGNML